MIFGRDGGTGGTLDTTDSAGGGVEARGTVNATSLLRVGLPTRVTLYRTHREHGHYRTPVSHREVKSVCGVPSSHLLRVSRWAHRAYGAGQTKNDPFWGIVSFGAGRQGTVGWVTREASRTRPAVRSVLGADQARRTRLRHTAGAHGL